MYRKLLTSVIIALILINSVIGDVSGYPAVLIENKYDDNIESNINEGIHSVTGDTYGENSNPVTEDTYGHILSTNVWATKTIIKTTETSTVHYSYSDRAHSTSIYVYYRNNIVSTKHVGSASSGSFEFKPDLTKEGEYRIEIYPNDIDGYFGSISIVVYKPIVIFIPGIMATDLYEGSRQVWPPNVNLGFSDLPKIRENVKKLRLNSEGTSILDITVGQPTSDYYKSIHDYLSEAGYNVVNFGYDWRMDNTDNAKELKNKINDELMNLPRDAEKKVSIVAHSMGGIVSAQYIKNGNQNKIDKLITLGTPFLGAPKAFYIYQTGFIESSLKAKIGISSQIKDIIPNITGSYQLFPSRRYFEYNNTYYINSVLILGTRKSETKKYQTYDETMKYLKEQVVGTNRDLINNAIVFHDSLDILNTIKSVDSYQIIGDQIGTMGKINKGGSSRGGILSTENVLGDGTVPIESSTIGHLLVPQKAFYIKETHDQLANNIDVQHLVKNILEGNPDINVPEIIRKIPKAVKTMQTRVNGPAELHMYDALENHTGYINSGSLVTNRSNESSLYDQDISVTEMDFESSESNIPFSSYYSDEENKFVLLDDENYKVVIEGTDSGTLDYSVIWYDENNMIDKKVRFDEVPVTPNTTFYSTTDKNGNIVLQSKNGEIIEQTIYPSVVLNGGDNEDETIPTISSEINGFKGVNEWYGSSSEDVYYSLTGHDNESGIDKIFYSINDAEYQKYEGTIILNQTGIYNIKSFARDRNKNDSEELVETIKLDKTKPTSPNLTIIPLIWTNQFVSVSLSGSTDADSGFQKYQYKIGQDGDWKDYSTPIIIDSHGVYNVFARAVDNVFNRFLATVNG